MKRALLVLGFVFGLSPASAGDEAPAPRDMVLLTVSGTIGESNRGALDPKKDSMLALQKADFKKAFAFDRAMLLGLEQGTVTATPPNSAPATFKGPLLREVLGRIEAAKMKNYFVAVDGYTGYLTPEDVDSVGLDSRARGRRRAARNWPAGPALVGQYAGTRREAGRRPQAVGSGECST